jgi:hypothetical protein
MAVNMNSTNYEYPCGDCKRQGNCTGDQCARWKLWFREKWQEVTEVFSNEN